MKDHDNESCICDICGKTYNNKSSLTYHRYNKHKEIIKNFSCEDCNKRFKTKKNLSNHMELHKTKYICEECGAQLKTKYGLTKHRKIHLEKSHVCPICGVAFSNLSSQKVHLLRHVGERPYVCDICGQNFSQRSPMMSHRKRKHPGDLPPLPPIKITDLLHGVRDKRKEREANH
ncbi:putative zinc finger protein 66 [Aphidius gifuensis]|uniref:putative zinc finger protein 66 n=1 Tax=Aphidius gifuensis TaxID=684658 RepID=UPI001CDC198A|nr:putative zinc finger protein 66 [Aphidius gifuensis]